jgi:enamine deaminase RidA (YjgF/YER057c/UK114 family)
MADRLAHGSGPAPAAVPYDPAVDERRRISSGSPFEPVMGYSRAVVVGDRVVVSGTAPRWPDGTVDPDVGAQARRCLEIVGGALTEAGATFADVVRTRIFLVDAADFQAVAEVHGEVFRDVRPANSTVVVAGLLDERWRLEIEVEAVRGAGPGRA